SPERPVVQTSRLPSSQRPICETMTLCYRVGGQDSCSLGSQQRKEESLMARTGIRKTAVSLAVAGAFAGGVSQAHASAFALIEQNASGLGNSYAGAAAAAEDASTIFYNPAGMSLLPGGMQVSAGLALINLSAKFSDSGSTQTGTPAVPSTQAPLGGTGGNAG